MKIQLYPKHQLLATWEQQREGYAHDPDQPTLCLRCGSPLDKELAHNALSRSLDVYVCSKCGSDEAMRDYSGRALPLREWYAVHEAQPASGVIDDTITLMPYNTFKYIYEGTQKQVPGYGGSRPVSEVVYSRSDYDGRKWWTTWHPMQEEKASPEKAHEIDSIMDTLLELPEFKTLRALRRTCQLYAEPTSEPTEFNLYGESPSFYLWLRLITREKDYNLYVHFYDKNNAITEMKCAMA